MMKPMPKPSARALAAKSAMPKVDEWEDAR